MFKYRFRTVSPMAEERCKVCGKPVKPLPYVCSYCKNVFCVEHRLPEKHGCEGLSELRNFKPVEVESLSKAISEFEAAQKKGGGFLSRLKRRFSRRG
ncbi:MAG: hypothetical protein AYL30_006310 [Candidatus Hecatellales archaeon B24]|nr:MAG: hypothetical protein AYL30_006310 [Candidatus Hecatellales archaeon B24]